MDKSGKYKDYENVSGYQENPNNDLTSLREQFKQKYAMEKGWDLNNLSEEQLNEIKSQKGYRCPGMICG